MLQEVLVANLLRRITSKPLLVALTAGGLTGCAGDPYEDVLNGTIAYPFYEQTAALGHNQPAADDRFVIRTITGNTEYVVGHLSYCRLVG